MVKVAQKVAPPTQILSFLNLHLPAAVAHLQPAQLTTDKSAIFQKFRFFFLFLFFFTLLCPTFTKFTLVHAFISKVCKGTYCLTRNLNQEKVLYVCVCVCVCVNVSD